MSATKRVFGDYTIKTVDSAGNTSGNVVFTTERLNVEGNLVVVGNMTTVSSVDLQVTDNVIVLNYGETGAGITLGTAGIEIDRGSEPTVGVRWNEGIAAWEFADAAGDYGQLIIDLEQEQDPRLGGNLIVNGFEIHSTLANVLTLRSTGEGDVRFITEGNGNISLSTSGSGYIIFDDYLRLIKQGSGPAAVTNNNFVYHKTVNSGGSGLFFTNNESNPNEDELISKQRAIVYGLIL